MANISIDELIEQVKHTVRIEDVIGREFSITGRGRRLSTSEHDSLKIDVDTQSYWWYSKGTHGDVISWVMERKGWDFKSALEELCRIGNLAAPDWSKQDPSFRVAAREREDVFSAASDVFHKWLLADAAALDYAHGRGWNDETISRVHLGFTGKYEERENLRKEMHNALVAAGIDPRAPAAVAILGLSKTDIGQWGRDYDVKVDQKWITDGKIKGVVGWGRLVYPHYFGARCGYFSLRDMVKKEHYNPVKELAGERQIYANSHWSKSAPLVVIVEGQADAITLDQWEIPAIALNGVAADERVAKFIGANKENKCATFYLGLDSDKAGSFDSIISEPSDHKPANTLKTARLLGPSTYILEWQEIGKAIIQDLQSDESIKDANDILKISAKRGMNQEEVKHLVGVLINNCSTIFVEKFAFLAGKEEGSKKDRAIKQAVEIITEMDEMSLAQKQGNLGRLLGLDQRELKRMIKAFLHEDKKDEDGEDFIFTMGGYIDGWVVDYIYDPDDGKALLAWREPNKRVDCGYKVSINGKKYAAMPPTETILKGGIQLASKLVEIKETRELAVIIEKFIKNVFLLSNPLFYKIISYYVLLTWVYDSFAAIPYLRATGEPGSGKSELMKRIGMLCYRTMSSSGASSTSSLFRMVERYKGTVLMDEMDLKDSGASAEIVKFLTQGAMEDGPIYRTEKVIVDGKEEFQETMFQTFCPKLVAMQGDFFDKAVGSRCITFPVQPRETYELKDAGIPLERTKQMKVEAQTIRNLLLRWRLENWQPQRDINPEFYNLNITARLNQVTVAILMIAENDEALRKDINKFMNEYHLYLIQDKAMSVEARIIEAMWKIYKYPDLHLVMVERNPDGREQIKIGNIKNIANQIMKEMNMDDDDKEEDDSKLKKKKKDAISAQMVGHRLREKLQFEITNRSSKGFYVIWDEKRMLAISRRYGVVHEELGPQEKDAKKSKPGEMPLAPTKAVETQITLPDVDKNDGL